MVGDFIMAGGERVGACGAERCRMAISDVCTAEEADRGHAGRDGAGNARHAVLNYGACVRLDTHPACSHQKDIWRRFATEHISAAEQVAAEMVPQAELVGAMIKPTDAA